MNAENLEKYAAIPQPPQEKWGFIDDLKAPYKRYFTTEGRSAGEAKGCLAAGYRMEGDGSAAETAVASLRRVLASKGIAETKNGYSILFESHPEYSHEEYEAEITASSAVLRFGDADGLRRSIYFLEDRLAEAEKESVMPGKWHRKPFIRHRVSRCFFGPTNRPPFFVDELMNDVDYYPEEYLNKLAHEGINGVWLTMYFFDIPCSVFPSHGKNAEQRFAKLRKTAEKCLKYGIRLYIYMCEPKRFYEDNRFTLHEEDRRLHPETMGSKYDQTGFFCTSTENGRKYISESVETLFRNVPQLGGIINITFGEDIGSCVAHIISDAPVCQCPKCRSREPGEIYHEMSELFAHAMHKYNPDAEYIGWFYAPGQRDGGGLADRIVKVAEQWPDDCTMMVNCESGAVMKQAGKDHTVYDYSLAFYKTSELFRRMCSKVKRSGAKIQVGCSHEDASVPFIPVPGNLFEKYSKMHEYGVSAVMQCWYFGNYPGLMNKAAGELSFEPFPQNEDDFLLALARPDWRNNAEKVVQAWKCFETGYRAFPINLGFEWYGPLHHSIAWPMYLFPSDTPMTPSWLLKRFPLISGDRIGECINFAHTLPEIVSLCEEMDQNWSRGMEILNGIRAEYREDPARMADLSLAEAVGLQIRSTRNIMKFYLLRYQLFYDKIDHLAEMAGLVRDEIANSRRMSELCRQDPRLGYHSEAEGYLFFPERLAERIRLLEELLEKDFPRFRMDDPVIDEWTGKNMKETVLHCASSESAAETMPTGVNGLVWKTWHDDRNVYFKFTGKTPIERVEIFLEPTRFWPSVWLNIAKDEPIYNRITFACPPDAELTRTDCEALYRFNLAPFDGIRRTNFPLRLQLWCYENGKPAGKFHPWQGRLMHHAYNPADSVWFVLD